MSIKYQINVFLFLLKINENFTKNPIKGLDKSCRKVYIRFHRLRGRDCIEKCRKHQKSFESFAF
ncbi:hypothetical protein JO40_00010 [Treponema putidum]|nr:hypothetical protein JO40_00010 [Treponema putidum]